MLLQENMVVADRFRLARMIGRGGMGSVWQAMHLGLDTPCAVKFIEGELANVAEAHARFEREAKAAAQLRSPHVVQIFDHGVWQGHPYIAMELLDGEDLGKRLTRHGGRLPPADVNTVVQQVCRALSKAHAAGVVHRDLKPDNIFIVTDDDREIVKILDFGVAKSTSQAIDGSNTKTGAMLGTPYYMSPEQAQGIKSVDARSDLWSLAVIVFQCLTGRLPFESEALGDLLVKIIVNPIPVPSQYNRDIPIGFDRWWTKAADRNVDGRFQTAKEFAQELAVALGQSSPGDTDRGALQRIGGGTAVMAHGPGTEVMSNVPNTPMPGAQTAALPTPNPAYGGAPSPAAGQPHGMTPPGMHGAHAGHGGHAQHGPHGISTGNPVVAATFSGVDSPAGVPAKKSPPIAVIAGIGLLALVGLGLGGVAIAKRSSNAGNPAASSSVATVEPSSTAPTAKNTAAEGPTAPSAATAAPEATAVASAASSAPATPSAPAAPPAAVAAKPAGGAGAGAGGGTVGAARPPAGNGNGGSNTTAATKPAAAPPAKPPTKPAGPINLGF